MAEGERKYDRTRGQRANGDSKGEHVTGRRCVAGVQVGKAPTSGFIAGEELSPLACGRSDGGRCQGSATRLNMPLLSGLLTGRILDG